MSIPLPPRLFRLFAKESSIYVVIKMEEHDPASPLHKIFDVTVSRKVRRAILREHVFREVDKVIRRVRLPMPPPDDEEEVGWQQDPSHVIFGRMKW